MKIAFISLYCFRSFAVRLFHPFTTRKGVETHSIFLKNSVANTHSVVSPTEEKLFLQLIEDISPDLIAFSVLAPYAVTARQLTAKIRKFSKAPIVLGGKYPTITPERALEFADFACVGEGEDVLVDIISNFDNGLNYKSIQGLWYKDPDGMIVDRGKRPLLRNLDDLPFPAINDDNMYFIENDLLIREDPEIHEDHIFMMAGRGCVYQCSFCVNSLLIPMNKGNGKFLRIKTPENLVREIQYFKTRYKNPSHIFFCDEVFGTNQKWTAEFCRLFVAAQVNLPFHVEFIPALIQEKNISLLADIGLKRVNFGIQSGNDHIRNGVLNRPGSNAQLIEKAELLYRHGVDAIYDIILCNPFESEDDKRETIGLLLTLPIPHHCNTFKMQFFPKYPFTLAALKAGFVDAAKLTDECVANSTMNEWAYIPRTTEVSNSDYGDNVIFLLAWNAPFSRLLSRFALRVRNKWIRNLVNHYARFVYLWFFSNRFRLARYVLTFLKLLKAGEFSEIANRTIRKFGLARATP